MDFVTSCIGLVVTTLAGWATPILKNMWYFNENVVEFQKKKDELEAKQESIQIIVEEARRKQKEKSKEMNSWMDEYECIKKECNDLDNQLREYARIQRCKFSQNVVTMTDRINKHIDLSGKFILMVVDLPPPNVEKVNIVYKCALHSIEEKKKAVYAALKDVSVIGLWGMGGVGKTTLMLDINNEMAERSDFKYVIMVAVSTNPNIKKIQKEIGRRLQLKLDDSKIILHRANIISERLKKEGSILFIFDDVCDYLDLTAIGIPCGDGENKCCKIVLTTRDQRVCARMGAKEINMSCLDPTESWDLFETKVGKNVVDPEIKEIAENVCKECAGLPLAISVMALTLENEYDVGVWRKSLKFLKEDNPQGVDGLKKNVYNPLWLFFEQLQRDDLKFGFLLYSLFPEDHAIQLGDLICYGIGEGSLAKNDKGLALLDVFHNLFIRLKRIGLLQDAAVGRQNKNSARMHDFVHVVAINIAKKEGFYINTCAGLTEWPPLLEEKKCRGLKYISLMENSIQEITHQPQNGEGVLFLSLNGNKRLKSIHSDFWEGMQNLLLLDLRGTSMLELTPCIQKLKKLRVLMFGNLWYEEPTQISFVNIEDLLALRNLSVLCLQNTHIPELKEEFGELVHLRVIDFTDTDIDIIRPKIFWRLYKLEVLRMNGSFGQWKASNEEDGDLVAFVELASLKHLYTLHVDIDDEYILSDEYTLVECFPSVEYFSIRSGHSTFHRAVSFFSNNLGSSGIQLKNIANWLKVLLKKTNLLEINGFSHGGKNLVDTVLEPDIVKVMHNLETLGIFNCPKCKKAIQYSSNTECDEPILPKLESMNLGHLYELDTIIVSTTVTPSLLPCRSFQSLIQIHIYECRALRFVFTWRMALCLVQLRTLTIKKCRELKHIIGKDGYDNFDYHSIAQVFPKLRSLELCYLPKLVSVWQQQRQENMQMQWSLLEDLKVSKCRNLRRLFLGKQSAPKLLYLFCEEEWFQNLIWQDEQAESIFKPLIIPYEESTMDSDGRW